MSTANRRRGRWYRPADDVVVRAPLLAVEDYRHLVAGGADQLLGDERVRRALGVGSQRLLDVVERDPGGTGEGQAALARYLIRMSTRPTPFGLFAGVAVAEWGDHTDLRLAAGPRPQRTRPDMAWLLKVVEAAEADAAIRRQLHVVANRAVLVRGGRVVLAERVSRGETPAPPAVSIRATGVVRRALVGARQPIRWEDLAALVLEQAPGASNVQVDTLLTQLWEQTLLLTELRPPLTVASPARYVAERLARVPEAEALAAALTCVIDEAEAWDRPGVGDGVTRYRMLVSRAAELAPFDRSPFQVDSALELRGRTVARAVADEAARAAELLLRLSPVPRGPAHLAAYRRRFEQRYGPGREVPVLELLDPDAGLGPPAYAQGGPDPGVSVGRQQQRNQALLDLAGSALHRRARSVTLDETALDALATSEPVEADLPRSLELNVLVAGESAEAIDAGRFRLVVGPNVGSMAAGRSLGRFADVVPGAADVLRRLAQCEATLEPGRSWAELSYQPRATRLGNVATRPNSRSHEIVVGVGLGTEVAHDMPVDELLIGVADGRLIVRWAATGQEVVITAGHMLTYLRAPTLCRFLSEVGRDGCCLLAGFSWGAASGLPFLPRVEVGRVVLSLAQWRLAAPSVPTEARADHEQFRSWVDGWRDAWDVPRHVHLNEGDNRLLLDLADAGHVEELRRFLRPRGGRVAVLSEVLPALDEAWVTDEAGAHFATELVVPLVRTAAAPAGSTRPPSGASGSASATAWAIAGGPPAVHLPGGEWLYLKLYGGEGGEDDLLAGPLRDLIAAVAAPGLADRWFFLRYHDPDRHLRVRFHGAPAVLVSELLPLVCDRGAELVAAGRLARFALDTYEPEVERFGGESATVAAERLFAADSDLVVELLGGPARLGVVAAADRLPVAVVTVDALLAGLGLAPEARAAWCRAQLASRQESGPDYRVWSGSLRSALTTGSLDALGVTGGDTVGAAVEQWRLAAVAYRGRCDELDAAGELRRPFAGVVPSLVHLHLNRLLGTDRALERRAVGLLGRVLDGLQRSHG